MFVKYQRRLHPSSPKDQESEQGIDKNTDTNKIGWWDDFVAAQADEVKYAGLLLPLLLYFSTYSEENTLASTVAVVGHIGHVWTRTFSGRRRIPVMLTHVLRCTGIGLLGLSLGAHGI
jgi:hypothetical protein